MNVLFTTAPAPKDSPFGTKEKRAPLGLGFLISIVRQAGHEIFFIDNYLKPTNFLDTNYLVENKIDFVCLSLNTICYGEALKMLNKIQSMREENIWNGKIVVGGPHTTVALDTIPDFVDFVVLGEGESAILDIIEGKEQNRVVKRDRLKKLDDLPFPAWDIFSKLDYDYTCPWMDIEPVFTMNTSRGCPFRCSFCSVDSIWGLKYSFYSSKRIVDEIKYLVDNFGAKAIYFREDNFTLRVSRVKEFCKLIIEEKIDINWACETRVDTLDEELIKLMHQAGCRAFFIGAESSSQRLLDMMNKRINVEQMKMVCRVCREVGINTYASFITGIPTETFEETRNTLKFINTELKPYAFHMSVFIGLPDSTLYRYVVDNKLYTHMDKDGLVYLPGYNTRKKIFYGDSPDMLRDEDESDLEFVKQVNALRQEILERIQKLVQRCKNENKKLAIYGAGAQTQRLFDKIDFDGTDIVGFYDMDKEKQKNGFLGHKVWSPDLVDEKEQDVLLISLTKPLYTVYDKLRYLKEKGIEVIPLYNADELYVIY